uniref:GST C-terminal domain-containing protein n=1 Tax=Anopheles minimus TaxID=112268 RepID=A0A182W703_9DIPT
PVTSGVDPTFYVTTDFILRLNELIKHLALYSLDDTFDSREVIEHAGAMWNQTEVILEDLVNRSKAPTDADRNGNLTNLHAALDAVRSEKNSFLKQMADYDRSKATEIDAISLIDRTTKQDLVMVDPGMTLIMHSSVHGLTNVTMGLLHSLEASSFNGRGQARANPTQPSVEMFLALFKRTIVDTQLNFQTQANRVLRRVRANLSALSTTPELGQYLTDYAALIATFKMEINNLLDTAYNSVVMSMTPYRMTIDEEISLGISELLSSAGMSTEHAFLYVCFKRYVFKYYDQSLAVAKLLHCGEPELRTLEYLVTVAGPILERAAISDSSAVNMNVICAIGSTECMNNFYTSLADQLVAAQARFQSMKDWPRDAVLYQPYEEEQILLAENASCLAVRTYLKMLNLPVALEQRANAEFISPGGKRTKLPVLRVENFIYAEFDHIVTFVEQNFNKSLNALLSSDEKDLMRSLICLAEHIFTNAEQYVSWIDPEVRDTVTKKRNGCVFPFPLNHVQNWRKEGAVKRQLRMADYLNVSLKKVIADVDHLCQDLSDRLGDRQYFFGNNPTELDALVFGHLYSIFTMKLPNNVLALTIHKYSNLNQFCFNIEKAYFMAKEKGK